MTAEELLATMAEPFAEGESYCTIDPETRVITIPPEYQLLGVESDEKAERLYFKCPKIVGDNIDLSKLALRVNFQNAGAVVDQYLVDDVAVDGDNITFSWLLSRRVTQYEGTVNFIVCAVKVSGDTITNEWNTTLAQAEVLEGLEVEVTIPEEETDIVNQLLSLAETRLNDVKEATADANTAASNANQKAQEAENAAEDARAVTEQITKDSYLHTALQSFIDSVKASPTAYGNAIPKKIEGFTRQETTQGLNLADYTGELRSCSLVSAKDMSFRSNINGQYYSEIVISSFNDYLLSHKGQKLTMSCEGNPSDKQISIIINGTGVSNGYIEQSANGNKVTITISEEIETINNVLLRFNRSTTTFNDTNTVIKHLMLYLGDEETSVNFEPYTGGQPAPNPDYPMEVQGTGFRGFFDGELTQGGISSSSGFPSGTDRNMVHIETYIPAETGDKISIYCQEPMAMINIFEYKEDLSFVKVNQKTESNIAEAVMSSDTKFFKFDVRTDPNKSLSPESASIVVKINGKYAVCVKSEGKNLIPYPYDSKSGTANEVNYKFDSTGRGILYGTATASGVVKLMQRYRDNDQYDKIMELKAGQKYYAKDVQIFLINNGVESYINAMDSAQYYTAKSGDNVAGIRLLISVGQTYTTDRIFEPMFCEYEEGDDTTFVSPAQSNIAYIPVDYPLFEGDKIIQRNGEYKLVRKNIIESFDETLRCGKNKPSDDSDYLYYVGLKTNANVNGKLYCDIFSKIADTTDPNVGIAFSSVLTYRNNIYVRLNSDLLTENNVEAFKQFAKDHNFMIAYESETPTEEPLSPEAVKALNSIMATDEQTELTIIGIPTDAGIQNQFLLPRNEDGALNTTAYCTAEKNKLTLDELLSQSLDSRVNKLEIDNAALAEQTIVVE